MYIGNEGKMKKLMNKMSTCTCVKYMQACKARVPLGSSAHQMYGMLCEHGLGDKDFSVVYDFLTKSSKK